MSRPGSLTIVGTGPGSAELVAPEALEALQTAEIVVGYQTYLNLIDELLPPGVERRPYGMRQEVERSRAAVQMALEGRRVCIVSGGDAGVFSIAGPVLEVVEPADQDRIALRVIPGITSALSSAALLGAPLVHDFAVISLSDLLTPAELIEKRLALAAAGDFVTVLYNPASKKRTVLIRRAAEIFAEERLPSTPVGIVRSGYRPGQEVILTTLDRMLEAPVDMSTTVLIGNSRTYRKGRFLVTPRGYAL